MEPGEDEKGTHSQSAVHQLSTSCVQHLPCQHLKGHPQQRTGWEAGPACTWEVSWTCKERCWTPRMMAQLHDTFGQGLWRHLRQFPPLKDASGDWEQHRDSPKDIGSSAEVAHPSHHLRPMALAENMAIIKSFIKKSFLPIICEFLFFFACLFGLLTFKFSLSPPSSVPSSLFMCKGQPVP